MTNNPNNIFKPTISAEEVSRLRLKAFEGRITTIFREDQVESALQIIEGHTVVGFDTETKPTFKKGEYNHVSLMQIALPDHVLLFRLNTIPLGSELTTLLANAGVLKVGIALADDIKSLQKLSPFEARGFLELNKAVKPIGIESNGLKKLTATILGYRISKSAQVSNWENKRLTEKQIRYAATDAWVCLEMYNRLVSLGFDLTGDLP